MTNKANQRRIVPVLIAIAGALLYLLMLWTAAPSDLPGYWDAFFRVRAGQIAGLALATCIYLAGLSLCIVAFSSLLPIRSIMVRRLLTIPGILSAGFGTIYIVVLLACFTDKVR